MMKILHIIIGACLVTLLPVSQGLGQQGQQGGGSSVTVINPTTNPAKTSSVDDPGRIPYQAYHQFPNTDCNVPGQCIFNFPSVPTGKRLVAQHIVVSALISSGNAVSAAIAVGNVRSTDFFVPIAGLVALGDQPVLFYVNGGSSFLAALSVDGAFDFSLGGPSITVTGYLLDCTVNLCAAIAP
jgi:hypothetical protein